MTKRGGWPASGFGGRLRTLREGAGLSQQQLADQAGCHRFTVAKLERAEQEPAWPLVLALAEALGVTCEAFTAKPVDRPAADSGRPSQQPSRQRKKRPRSKPQSE